DNFVGILASSSDQVHNNRVYHNADAGISADYGSSLTANVVYSNLVGVKLTSSFNSRISNNLIYANANQGIYAQAIYSSGFQVVNNTIYQPAGDAVRLERSVGVQLRNNILWAPAGYDLSVSNDSQSGFASDYNILYTSGTGQVA